MEILIKYRNERKKEGASQAELNGLDGRINACMSNAGQEKTAFDIELLSYRAQISAAIPLNRTLLDRLDAHIFHQLGSTPAKIIDVKVRTISMGPTEGIPVAVDINNETVGDLGKKATAAIGMTGNYKVIFNGKHHDDLMLPLSTTNLSADSLVAICKRLGCDGNCCERTYTMLADAMYRDVHKLFKDVKPDVIHELFVVFSRLQEDYANKRPKLNRPVEVECRVLPEAFRPRREDSDWASLLSAARTRQPFRPWSAEVLPASNSFSAGALLCEALPCKTTAKTDEAVAALCRLLSEPTEAKAQVATATPTLNPSPNNNITVPPTSSTLPLSDDEDLYS